MGLKYVQYVLIIHINGTIDQVLRAKHFTWFMATTAGSMAPQPISNKKFAEIKASSSAAVTKLIANKTSKVLDRRQAAQVLYNQQRAYELVMAITGSREPIDRPKQLNIKNPNAKLAIKSTRDYYMRNEFIACCIAKIKSAAALTPRKDSKQQAV